MSGDPARADVEAVHAGLDGFSRVAVDLAAVRPLGCFVRLPSGGCVDGAIVRTWEGCCEITQFWVDAAHRAQGLGSGLVHLVEDEARARGCSLVYLDTFSFQAPGWLLRSLGLRRGLGGRRLPRRNHEVLPPQAP